MNQHILQSTFSYTSWIRNIFCFSYQISVITEQWLILLSGNTPLQKPQRDLYQTSDGNCTYEDFRPDKKYLVLAVVLLRVT